MTAAKGTAIISQNRLTGKLDLLNTSIGWSKQLHEWYRQRTEYTVSVDSEDRLYERVHRWLTDQNAGGTNRGLTAKLGSVYELESAQISYVGAPTPDTPPVEPPRRVVLYHDTGQNKNVIVEGHTVTVSVVRDEAIPEGGTKRARMGPDKIRFRCRSAEAQRAVTRLLEELARDKTVRAPALHLLNAWGSWNRRDDLPPRSLESVILKRGQMEELRGDLEAFLAAEPEYNRRGLPWHRGYFLYGPPGTGKTSVVRALAATLKLDLWYAPLGDLRDDTSLLSLINEVRPRSILLLEDFDVYHAARVRNDEGESATTAGLLNALDGVATPHGLITFMTSNNRDAIDPALLRPGRVDFETEVGLADAEQVARAWGWFYDCPPYPTGPGCSAEVNTIAEAIEVFKRYPDDPLTARYHARDPWGPQSHLPKSQTYGSLADEMADERRQL